MTAGKLDSNFDTKTVTLRDKPYTLREISGTSYDEAWESAKSVDSDGEEVIVNATLWRLMALASITEPKLDLEGFNALPFKVRERLIWEVRQIHFTPEESKEERSAREAEERRAKEKTEKDGQEGNAGDQAAA